MCQSHPYCLLLFPREILRVRPATMAALWEALCRGLTVDVNGALRQRASQCQARLTGIVAWGHVLT